MFSGDWANKAAIYEWKEEYGEIGPRFEALEKQLFGNDFHVRSGIKFDRYVPIGHSKYSES